MTTFRAECPAVIVRELASPVRQIEPAGRRISPVVVTSPHSGRHYPRQFIDQTILALDDLRKVEDAGVDRLLTFQPLPAPILIAEFPRSFVDVNRQYDEIDADMFDGPVADISPTVTRYLRSGLGMIPKKAANQQNIYNNSLPADEAGFRRDCFISRFIINSRICSRRPPKAALPCSLTSIRCRQGFLVSIVTLLSAPTTGPRLKPKSSMKP
jgi:hypothetical protein